jgi:hypothetical protein
MCNSTTFYHFEFLLFFFSKPRPPLPEKLKISQERLIGNL